MRQLIHSIGILAAALAALIPACAQAGLSSPREMRPIEPPICVVDGLAPATASAQGFEWGRSVARAKAMLAWTKDQAAMDEAYDFSKFAIVVEADSAMSERNPEMWFRDGRGMAMPPVLASLGRRAGEEVILVDVPAALVPQAADGSPAIRSWRDYFPGLDKAAADAERPEPLPSPCAAMEPEARREWIGGFEAGAGAGEARGESEAAEWRLRLERDYAGMLLYKVLLDQGVVTLPKPGAMASGVSAPASGKPRI